MKVLAIYRQNAFVWASSGEGLGSQKMLSTEASYRMQKGRVLELNLRRRRLFIVRMITGEEIVWSRNSIFWGIRFDRGNRRTAGGRFFIGFSPAISNKAAKSIRETMRQGLLHRFSTQFKGLPPNGIARRSRPR